MSEDFENYLRSQTLKEPSADLDDRVLGLFDEQKPIEVKAFPWQKFATYAVAAMLFLSIGVAELIQRANSDSGNLIRQNFSNGSSTAVPTMKVSTHQDLSKDEKLRKTNNSLSR